MQNKTKSDQFKQEVLKAFQKVSPSRIDMKDEEDLKKYAQNHYNLFFKKLKFPPELFKGKKIIDFGCGTGEVDVVLASWGATVQGFDFNPISIERANGLRNRFEMSGQLSFGVGEMDTFKAQPESIDMAVSFGVIAHVPDQHQMFQLMAKTVKPGGYVVLGYVEDSGLIQRLLHRAIIRVNSDNSDEEIFRIAKACFAEHIDRSVRYGGRTAESVINDYLVNPHYIGLSSHTLLNWAKEMNLEFYSTWPSAELSFVVDSPYFEPLERGSEIYKLFLSLNRLRWVFAQQEDSVVFSELMEGMSGLGEAIETFLSGFTEILQGEKYTETDLSTFRNRLNALIECFDRTGNSTLSYLNQNLGSLSDELERVLTLIVQKAVNGSAFDLEQLNSLLFKGYNGFGPSYTIWHKPE
jgi:2-polyprenyl-3-methyl-5-hydroxy-6-metoxy-1,4-benzoquinol methylase